MLLVICRYEREIHSLRQELVMHDALSGRTGVRYGPLDENDRAWIAAAVNGYVRGDVDDLEVIIRLYCLTTCISKYVFSFSVGVCQAH